MPSRRRCCSRARRRPRPRSASSPGRCRARRASLRRPVRSARPAGTGPRWRASLVVVAASAGCVAAPLTAAGCAASPPAAPVRPGCAPVPWRTGPRTRRSGPARRPGSARVPGPSRQPAPPAGVHPRQRAERPGVALGDLTSAASPASRRRPGCRGCRAAAARTESSGRRRVGSQERQSEASQRPRRLPKAFLTAWSTYSGCACTMSVSSSGATVLGLLVKGGSGSSSPSFTAG